MKDKRVELNNRGSASLRLFIENATSEALESVADIPAPSRPKRNWAKGQRRIVPSKGRGR